MALEVAGSTPVSHPCKNPLKTGLFEGFSQPAADFPRARSVPLRRLSTPPARCLGTRSDNYMSVPPGRGHGRKCPHAGIGNREGAPTGECHLVPPTREAVVQAEAARSPIPRTKTRPDSPGGTCQRHRAIRAPRGASTSSTYEAIVSGECRLQAVSLKGRPMKSDGNAVLTPFLHRWR